MNLVLQWLGKIFFTIGLIWIILLCGIEIWRIWFKKTLVVAPFRYKRKSELVSEVGRDFADQLSQDLNQIQTIYNRKTQREREIELPSTDQIGRGSETFKTQDAALSDLEVEIYGIPVSKIGQNFLRWIEQSNEVKGSIFEKEENNFDVYLKLHTPSLTAIGKGQRWYLSEKDKNINEVSFKLSCYLFHQLLTQKQPSSPYSKLTNQQFYLFTGALENYQQYSLADASQYINQLLEQNIEFAVAYKLAGYIFWEKGQIQEAKKNLTTYKNLLAQQKHKDEKVETLLAKLQSSQTQGTDYFRQKHRPIHPGISVSPDNVSTAGTMCCIVKHKDPQKTIRYVLSDENVFLAQKGTSIIQPGILDGGQLSDKIGIVSYELTTLLNQQNTAAGVIAELDPGIRFSSNIPNFGQIEGITEDVKVDQEIIAIGRTSGIVRGKVTAINVSAIIFSKDQKKLQFQGLIETEPISKSGDSGSPVFIKKENGKYQLVGIIYAGSSTKTLVIPIQNILEAFKKEYNLELEIDFSS